MITRAWKLTAGLLGLVLTAACAKESPPANEAETPVTKGPAYEDVPRAPARIEITVTDQGFRPEKVSVPAGEPVRLVFKRITDNTCAKEVVLQVGESNRIERELPLDQPVEVAVTFPTAGELKYTCGMNMLSGIIRVE